MAEEKIGVAGGAQIANENIRVAETGSEQLRAIGFAQVQANIFGRWLVAGGHLVEPLQRIGLFTGAELVEEILGVGKLRGEFGDQFCADFVAAGTDGWSDCGEDVGRLRTKVHAHFADGFLRDAREGSAPTGMDRGYRAFLYIDQQYGDAVGGLYTEQQAFCVGQRSIAVARLGGSSAERPYNRGVKLFQWNQNGVAGAKRRLKTFAILQNRFAFVPIGEAKIQNAFAGAEHACASVSGAETVHQPG